MEAETVASWAKFLKGTSNLPVCLHVTLLNNNNNNILFIVRLESTTLCGPREISTELIQKPPANQHTPLHFRLLLYKLLLKPSLFNKDHGRIEFPSRMLWED